MNNSTTQDLTRLSRMLQESLTREQILMRRLNLLTSLVPFAVGYDVKGISEVVVIHTLMGSFTGATFQDAIDEALTYRKEADDAIKNTTKDKGEDSRS